METRLDQELWQNNARHQLNHKKITENIWFTDKTHTKLRFLVVSGHVAQHKLFEWL